MVRRYHEPIWVRVATMADLADLADLAAPAAGAPTAFIWRGRLHVVRQVLGHWRERRAWWRDALDRDARSGEVPPGQVTPDPGGDELEQEVWRVEASIGRLLGSGVYDVARHGRDTGEQWRLVRVAD